MASGGTVENEAFVTLATNDTYSLGALVLANSLRRFGTTRKLAIMITSSVSSEIRQQLTSAFDVVAMVDVLDSRDVTNLALLTRPDLGVTFTKLHCWRLTQFSKCVFLDADTLVLQNCDELFDREEFSAAPDAGWPDCFNSGVFVYRPSIETYTALLEFAVSHGSFDGGDQGLLNLFFSDWATKDIKKHLPFTYNVVSQAFYSYLPAFRQFGKNVKIVHFIGSIKPWHASFNTATQQVEPQFDTFHHQDYLQLWWSLFMDKVNPSLGPEVNRNIYYKPSATSHPSANQEPAQANPLTNQEPVPCHTSTPYIPPDVPIYYEPVHSCSNEHLQDATPHVIEAPPCDRTYQHFENFYSEPPMGNIENYPSLDEVYSSRNQQDVLEKYVKEPENEETFDEILPESIADIHHDDLSLNSNNVNKDLENQDCRSSDETNIGSETRDGESDLSSVNGAKTGLDLNQNQKTEPKSKNANRTVSSLDGPESDGSLLVNQSSAEKDQSEGSVSLLGIEGELTSLRIDGGRQYTPEQLQSRQRQYEWERGHVDYMGIDSFTLIQKHLDDIVSGRTTVTAPPVVKEKKKDEPETKGKVKAEADEENLAKRDS